MGKPGFDRGSAAIQADPLPLGLQGGSFQVLLHVNLSKQVVNTTRVDNYYLHCSQSKIYDDILAPEGENFKLVTVIITISLLTLLCRQEARYLLAFSF